MKFAVSILALLIAATLSAACGGGEPTEPAMTAKATPTPMPVPTPEPTAAPAPAHTPTPEPTRTSTPEPAPEEPPTPAIGTDEYLGDCRGETLDLVAALDIDLMQPEGGDPVTWTEFARTLDTALNTYGSLEPSAELGAFHAAHLDVLRSLRDAARARTGASSVSGDLAALVSDVIIPELLEHGLGAEVTEEQERVLERIVQGGFAEFFGPAFMAALLAEEEAVAALSAGSRAAVERSGCYLAFSPFEIDAPTDLLVPNIVVVDDDHGDSPEQATRIGIGDEIRGSLDHTGDLDFFEFAVREGMIFRIDVEPEDPRDGVAAALFDSRGELLADNEDIGPVPIEWRAGRSGSYYAAVGGEGTGRYAISVTWLEDREVAACEDTGLVAGTVTYRERIALTPGAVVEIELRDVSYQDAHAPLIASQTIFSPGQVPIGFTVEYRCEHIDPRNTYSISARIIESGGRLAFINDTAYEVITRQNPDRVDMVLVMVEPPPDMVDVSATPMPVSEAEEAQIKAELAGRSFRQFEPSRDASPRKAVIIDFFNGISIWAQYAEGDHALREWEIASGDYKIEKYGDRSEIAIHLDQPRSFQILPTECEGCIEADGFTISIRDVFDSEKMSFRLNDPSGTLPAPFPVFGSWTRFQEDIYFE